MALKKIIAYVCILSILFSVFVKSGYAMSADDPSNIFTFIDWWDLMRFMNKGDDNLQTPMEALGIMRENGTYGGCPSSPDGCHVFDTTEAVLAPVTGYHYQCIYCGQKWSDYCSDAYEQALEDNGLANTTIDSEGGLIWYPTAADFVDLNITNGDYYSISCSGNHIYYIFQNSQPELGGRYTCQYSFSIKFPYDGSYSSKEVPRNWYVDNPIPNHNHIMSGSSIFLNDEGSYTYRNSGDLLSFSKSDYFESCVGNGIVDIGPFCFRFVPEASSSSPSQVFYTVINNINSTSMNIATVNESNEITNVYQDTTIINNDNTQITIPDGDTYNITDYDFDFSTNTYHLHVLEDGIEIPVELKFGIDGITISFPDNEYHYHYVTETDPEPSPTPGPVDPSPSPSIPTPTPSGRPDWWPEDYDTDDTQDWNRLFQWLNDFKTWLGKKLDQLIGKDPVIINNYEYEDTDGNKQTWDPHTLKDKFAFWTDVRDIGTELYSSVQAGGDAPELIIHLGAANSPFGFQYGGDEYALDLSWYGQYKESVDSISGGFLWLLYLYGIFKHLPEIFSGVGMMDNRVEDIESGHKARRRGK